MFNEYLGVDVEKLRTVEAVRRAIKERGCGPLAKRLGVTRQELQRIAAGERPPSDRILKLMGIRRLVFYANESATINPRAIR